MPGFLLLHWTRDIDPTVISNIKDRSGLALRRSHPYSSSAQVAALESRGFCCLKLDTPDSACTLVFKNLVDGSWIFIQGPATYEGKRTTDSDLSRLLADIRHDPVAASKRLDGVFVAIAFDSVCERVFVIPSALGQSASYLRSTAQGIVAVSSSILALTALGEVSLDEFGCHSLYRCGHRLPPNTIFREIQSVAEGSIVEVSNGRLNVRRYWTPLLGQPLGTLSETAREISQQLSSYCSSLIEPNAAVVSDLTGGLDSRVTTACLLGAGIPFTPTVAGSATHPDVVVARHICEKENLPLQAIDPSEYSNEISRKMGSALLLAEGCIDTFTCAVTAQVKERLFQTSGRPVVAVSGALGECYRDFFWAQEFFDRGKRQRASVDKLIRYRFDANPKRMDFFANDWHQEWRTDLQSYLGQIVDAYPVERNTSQIDAVYVTKMAGAIGGFSSAFGKWSVPLLPFTSIKALNIALAVPPEWRRNSRLLRQIAWLLHSRFANYMTLEGCPCAPANLSNWHRFLPKYIAEAKRLARKASTVWLGRTVFPEHTDPAPAHNPCVTLIDQETCSGGHFDLSSMHTGNWYAPQALASLLREARLPDGFRYRGAVSWIYTCEAMARLAHGISSGRSQSLGAA